jgi:hypothetical protein
MAETLRERIARAVRDRLSPPAPPLWKPRTWAIGIYAGASPERLAPAEGLRNPVLTPGDVNDMAADLIADPFILRADGAWHMFFEAMSRAENLGRIALATSGDGYRWEYRGVVLRESFHLSYPHVFEWQGEHYMTPEACQSGALRLYRARRFPDRWEWVGNLLEGGIFVDPSPFPYDGRWWMFVETSAQQKNDTLRLYLAERPEGPWREHPASPVVAGDPRAARPAGRVVVDGRRVIRFAQDCGEVYGRSVRAYELTRLTTAECEERPLGSKPVLAGSGRGWNRLGMHHVDAHRLENGHWLACVDGWTISPDEPARDVKGARE